MAKVRVQQELALARPKEWGGKRKGAGRPPANRARSSEPHKRRPEHVARHPVHVTMRVERVIGTLRRRVAYHAVRRAMQAVLGRDEFRIVHISLEHDHLHVIVEAATRESLARGVQGFEIAAARHLNAALSTVRGRRRRGRVFVDRYHARAITTPTQARNCLRYVLNNWRRHRQDGGFESMFWDVDYFSSGPTFAGWKEGAAEVPERYRPLPVSPPRTWLLSHGWRKAGPISVRDLPGPRE